MAVLWKDKSVMKSLFLRIVGITITQNQFDAISPNLNLWLIKK